MVCFLTGRSISFRILIPASLIDTIEQIQDFAKVNPMHIRAAILERNPPVYYLLPSRTFTISVLTIVGVPTGCKVERHTIPRVNN